LDVGRTWNKADIVVAAARGPHISALVPDTIAIMHAEVNEKVEDGFSEVVYLDQI